MIPLGIALISTGEQVAELLRETRWIHRLRRGRWIDNLRDRRTGALRRRFQHGLPGR